MTEPFEDFQAEIDAALADPVRRARVDAYGREIDVILALEGVREVLSLTQEADTLTALAD